MDLLGELAAAIAVFSTLGALARWAVRRVRRPLADNAEGHDERMRRQRASALGLRIADVDVERALATFGRVPLERPPQTSIFMSIRSFLQHLACRPSSPKPAFAVSSCERTSENDDGSAGTSLFGGFVLRIALHKSEHREHFIRSIGSSIDGMNRTIAVCSPNQLSYPGSRIRCYLVDAARRIHQTNDFHAQRLRLNSSACRAA